MSHQQDLEVRVAVQREFGHHRTTAPGVLKVWNPSSDEPVVRLKEVIAVIRPERYHETKRRVQRLRLQAFTQHRVLGRGHARGLRYLPRLGATSGTGVRYLPKRMLSWIVEETQVEPLIRALIEANQTGQLGDGKIFVLPVEEAIRIRTGERGVEAVQTRQPFKMLWGAPIRGSDPVEMEHASRQ